MRLKALITSLCVIGLFTVPAFAAAETQGDQSKIEQISSDTQAMQKELAELRHEVAVLKKQNKQETHKKTKQPRRGKHPLVGSVVSTNPR